MVILYDYHGEQLSLQEIAVREKQSPSTVNARRKRNPGKDWTAYMETDRVVEVIKVGGKEYTYAEAAKKAKLCVPTMHHRYKMLQDGLITEKQFFQTEALVKDTSKGTRRGNAEYRSLKSRERLENLKTKVGSWERENLRPGRNRTVKRTYNGDDLAYYPGQFALHR